MQTSNVFQNLEGWDSLCSRMLKEDTKKKQKFINRDSFLNL